MYIHFNHIQVQTDFTELVQTDSIELVIDLAKNSLH